MLFDAFEGDIAALVAALYREKQLRKSGSPAQGAHGVAIYADSGLLLGIQTAACLLILELLGLRPSVKTAVGCSTGMPPIAYWLAGQVARGLAVYFRECVSPNFLNLRKLVSNDPNVHAMGVDFLRGVFNNSTGKGIACGAISRASTDAYAVVTDWETAQPRHLPLRDSGVDPVLLMTASLADPVFSHGNVVINGRRFCDGNIAAPFGISHVLKRFRPQHLLVIANGSEEQKLDPKRYPNVSALQRLPEHIRAAISRQPEIVARELKIARASTDCNIVVFWGPCGNPVSRNGGSIRDLGKRAAQMFLPPFREFLGMLALNPELSP